VDAWLDRLPFREIWAVDGEWYPGPGKANGGVDGDLPTPYCLCAYELRSKRLIKLQQHELGPFPPYRLDRDSLVCTYMMSADYGGIHLPLGWGRPAFAFDAYVEFRRIVNDATASTEKRKKGFYSLAGALRYFGLDELDVSHKDDMRDRMIQGPPFAVEEDGRGVDYCVDDTLALARLLPHLIARTPSLPHAHFRADVQWAMAEQERRGVPMAMRKVVNLRANWDDIRADLVREMDASFGCYEFDRAGVPHFREKFFAAFLCRNREHNLDHLPQTWPALETGELDLKEQTFRDMGHRYPAIEPLRELRYTLSKLKLNDLAVGGDGRNRVLLGAYGTKTGRNAPSNSKFVFGPAKWIRFLIEAPLGRALIHRDYCQQEPRIAAILSDDRNLLEACESEDLYLGCARQLGFVRESMNGGEVKDVRTLFKVVVLAISYGVGPYTLAVRVGVSLYEAQEILARMRARFHRFEDFSQSILDQAGLDMRLSTPLDWTMRCPPHSNPRTLRNFPIQSTGAEILHTLVVLAERRRIEIVAPIHDAVLVECEAADVEEMKLAVDRTMRDASALLLNGYELPTDCAAYVSGEHFIDERGRAMWDTITRLLAKRGVSVA
jgi:DNA polymerase-1